MKYSITSFILSLLFLCACNEEEISRKTDPLPDGVMRLSATIRNGVKTRALGDPLSDATADEKRVDRLAFFVHTEAEGLQIYPPAPVASVYPTDPNKVHLVDNGDGTYTANVDLTAGGGYEADVVAVANLPEDYDYSQIVTWQGLLDSVTVATATMPLCTGEYVAGKKNAFIMYASATVALHKEKEAEISFAMERLVARIDITNKAYGTGRNAFVLTGARILQAKPASYVTPHDLYASPEVVTVSDWRLDNTLIKLYKGEVTTDNETTEAAADAVCQAAWHALYTYENDDVSHAPTYLEVTGTMNGATITRKIPFEVMDADGITKNPVPIVRNHRYLVQINPAPGQTDISYKLTVDEWNAVDMVNVQPNQDQVPVISNYACAEATNTFGTFDASTGMPDTIVVPATGGAISFTASCPFDTRVTMDYASSDDGNGWLEVTSRSEVTVTKAESSLARTYEITVKPNVGLDATLVNRGYLYIANGANGSVMDTVTIYQGANIAYGETRFAAVTVNGGIWAPINVGATKITKSDDVITEDAREEICGYLYQWGRNVPLKYKGNPGDIGLKSDVLSDMPLYEEACQNTGKYAGKFIGRVVYSWFKDYKSTGLSGLISSGDNAWSRKYQPCPKGWRVPTITELTNVVDNAKITDGKWVSTSNDAFVLPAAGYREPSGSSIAMKDECRYWTSTYIVDKEIPESLTVRSSGITITSFGSTDAFSIRCIKE